MTDQDRQRLADGEACLNAGVEYLKLGWSVLPLCPPDHVGIARVSKTHSSRCQNPGKVPWILWKDYQSELPTQEDLGQWWKQLCNSNVGIALGPVSGLVRVDIEGAAGEARLLEKSKGDLPRTLEFRSGRKDGTGRGLLYAIPHGVVLRTTYEQVGVRQELRLQAKGAQTVLPPSRHPDGGLYAWSVGLSPFDLEVCLAPEWILDELSASKESQSPRSDEDWQELIKEGVSEGARNSTAAAFAGKLFGNASKLTDSIIALYWQMVRDWNDKNDPPLAEDELQRVFISILKKEKSKRAEDDQKELELQYAKEVEQATSKSYQSTSSNTPPPDNHQTNGKPHKTPDWHLIVINSVPKQFLLKATAWMNSECLSETGGYLKLTAGQIADWRTIKVAAVEQAEVRIANKFDKWPSTLNKLLANAEHRETIMEYRRPDFLSHFCLEHLREAAVVRVDDNGDPVHTRGAPMLLPDGKLAVKSDWLARQASSARYTNEPIKLNEVADVLKRFGMKVCQLGSYKQRSRWWVMDGSTLDVLGKTLYGQDDKS